MALSIVEYMKDCITSDGRLDIGKARRVGFKLPNENRHGTLIARLYSSGDLADQPEHSSYDSPVSVLA